MTLDRRVLAVAVLAALLTTLPILMGAYVFSTPEKVFNGFEYPEDFHSYVAYVQSGTEGSPILLANNSTSEPQDPRYIVLFFTPIALANQFLNIPIEIGWNALRFLAIVILLLTIWDFTRHFFANEKDRWIAFLLASFGGGFGWFTFVSRGIVPIFGNLYATDLTYSHGYTVFSYLFHPLGVVALTLVIVAASHLLEFVRSQQLKSLGIALIALLGAFFNHPAGAVVGFFLLGVIVAWNAWRVHTKGGTFDWRVAGMLALTAGIVLLYTLWARRDAIYAFHQAYYIDWAVTLPWFMLPYALGIPLVLAAISLWKKLALSTHEGKMLLVFWALVALGLSLFFPAGIKYQYLLFLPVAFLAVPAFGMIASLIESQFKVNANAVLVIGLVLMCLTVPALTLSRVNEIQTPKHYWTAGEENASTFLDMQEKGVVFAYFETGSMLSWKTHHLPYSAHGFLTLDFESKNEKIAQFFGPQTPLNIKQQILQDSNATYVFYGPKEQALGEIDAGLGLESLYSSEGTTLYRVPSVK